MSRVPFQLLELNVISAQDLAPVSKNLRTYAVAWVNPDRKIRTRIDQQGQINPIWNDKFVFRVDDSFLNSDTSVVIVEIYALGWLRDTLVGSVRILITNLIPVSVRQETGSSKRFVALQICRPSGRPQGILNMGVTLLDNTMYSMPLCSELSAPAMGSQALTAVKTAKESKDERFDNRIDKKIQLWRTLSDKTDLISKDGGKKKKNGSFLGYGSVINYGANGGGGSVVDGGGSAVNGGSMVNGSLCNSDVGPSASVVAAAVAAGLYPRQLGPPPKPGSSVLEDWTVEESSMEGLKSKIERWRMGYTYDHNYQRLGNGGGRGNRKQKRDQRRGRRRKWADEEDGPGMFSCFGNAYGCEFTIVCCTNNGGRKNRAGGGYTSSKVSISELDS